MIPAKKRIAGRIFEPTMSAAAGPNEAFSRVVIDDLLKDVGWNLTDGHSVRYEYQLPDGTRADYVLCDRHGRALVVIEAKRSAVNPADAATQGRAYAEQLKVPYIFLANAGEILFWEYEREAYPRPVRTFFSQEDLARRFATRQVRADPLTVAIDKNIAGRDYQMECIDTLCREMRQGRRKLLVEMATGTGKTRMAAALIKRLFQANAITRVLFLVDRVTLAKQTEDAFVEHLRDYPCYVLRAGRRFQDEKRVTITTLQSMIGIYRDYSAGYFDIVITDECHRSIYGKWSGILKYFDGVQIGLTATPFSLKGRDLPDDEDEFFIRDTLRFFEVEEPTYRYTLRQAIADGYLVPYQIYKAQTIKTAAEGGFEVKRGELDWSAMDAATKQELEQLFGAGETMTVDPAALERKFTIPERNRVMVREFRDVMRSGFRDTAGIVRKPLIGKTIVFAVTKRHAETLARMFDEAFADEKPDPSVRYADYVVSGMGRDDTVDGGTKIQRFKKDKFPQIMVSVNMLDTGFDFPEVVNLVMARFTKSVVLYRQMRGRGTRKAPGKASFTLFDFAGVVDFHGDDDDTAMGGFVKESRARPHGQPRKLLTLDVDDHIDPATREWVTVDDNGNFTFLEPSQERAAQLGARFESWLLGQDGLSADQSRWLRNVGEQIRANAEAWGGFSVDRLVMPPFSLAGGLQRAIRIFGGEDKLQAVIASLNAAVYEEGRPTGRGEARPPLH
jgi:type I restriction enzyme R subunit